MRDARQPGDSVGPVLRDVVTHTIQSGEDSCRVTEHVKDQRVSDRVDRPGSA